MMSPLSQEYAYSEVNSFMTEQDRLSSSNHAEIINRFQPLSRLEEFIQNASKGCLQVHVKTLSWWIYCEDSQIIYSACSAPEHRRHALNQLKFELRNKSYPAFVWLESNTDRFLNTNPKQDHRQPLFEHQIIRQMLEQQYLDAHQASGLIKKLTQATLESFLLLTEGTVAIDYQPPAIAALCKLDPKSTVEHCQARLRSWQALAPLITSPYQCPYVTSPSGFYRSHNHDTFSQRLKSKLASILQGRYSLRQIAAILQQDELKVAQFLYPYIHHKWVALGPPKQPPLLSYQASLYTAYGQRSFRTAAAIAKLDSPRASAPTQSFEPDGFGDHRISQPASAPSSTPNKPNDQTNSPIQRQPIIACVDDSLNTLGRIDYFLRQEDFTVFKFSEPLKATFELRRLKPDLILTDLTMPKISGYELCQMLRNLRLFKETPIIIVTSKRGIIDKARAKLVGATDYLEKPFDQDDLLGVIYRYLD